MINSCLYYYFGVTMDTLIAKTEELLNEGGTNRLLGHMNGNILGEDGKEQSMAIVTPHTSYNRETCEDTPAEENNRNHKLFKEYCDKHGIRYQRVAGLWKGGGEPSYVLFHHDAKHLEHHARILGKMFKQDSILINKKGGVAGRGGMYLENTRTIQPHEVAKGRVKMPESGNIEDLPKEGDGFWVTKGNRGVGKTAAEVDRNAEFSTAIGKNNPKITFK
jgi:hypothetical protein